MDDPDNISLADRLRIVLAMKDVDDTKLREAFAAEDEAAVEREWNIWIGKLQEKADDDPVFGKWFEAFRADQEKLMRWDDTLAEDDE